MNLADVSNVRIQVIVEKETPQGKLRDAIYYSPDEFAAATTKDHQAEIDKRAAAFVDRIENPPPVPELTKEEAVEEAKRLSEQLIAFVEENAIADSVTVAVDVKEAAEEVKE